MSILREDHSRKLKDSFRTQVSYIVDGTLVPLGKLMLMAVICGLIFGCFAGATILVVKGITGIWLVTK